VYLPGHDLANERISCILHFPFGPVKGLAEKPSMVGYCAIGKHNGSYFAFRLAVFLTIVIKVQDDSCAQL